MAGRSRASRVLALFVAAVLLFGGALVVGSWVAEERIAHAVQARLAASLDAEVTVGAIDVSLLRGRATIRNLKVRRERGGVLTIDCPEIAVEFRPLGISLFDRTISLAVLSNPKMYVSALGVLAIRKRSHRPLVIKDLRLDNGTLQIVGSSILPSLAEVNIRVASARSRNIELKTGLSWVFGLESLDATAKVNSSVSVGVVYQRGNVLLRGSLFGSEPLRVPFAIPAPDGDAFEPAQLRTLGKSLAKNIGKAWLRREVGGRLRSLFD